MCERNTRRAQRVPQSSTASIAIVELPRQSIRSGDTPVPDGARQRIHPRCECRPIPAGSRSECWSWIIRSIRANSVPVRHHDHSKRHGRAARFRRLMALRVRIALRSALHKEATHRAAQFHLSRVRVPVRKEARPRRRLRPHLDLFTRTKRQPASALPSQLPTFETFTAPRVS